MVSFNWKALVMEALGTFALCYFGGLGFFQGPYSHGFALGFMVYCGAHISGAHYNPAVTAAMIQSKHINWLEGLFYMVAQLVGGIVAGLLIGLGLPAPADGLSGEVALRLAYPNICLCPNGVNLFYTQMTGFFMEFIGTFFLVFVIYAVAVDKRAKPGINGLCIGGALVMNMCGTGLITGSALNPARYLGPALGAFLTSPVTRFESHAMWIYFAGPFAGAALASFVYNFVFMEGGSSGGDDDGNDVQLGVDVNL